MLFLELTGSNVMSWFSPEDWKLSHKEKMLRIRLRSNISWTYSSGFLKRLFWVSCHVKQIKCPLFLKFWILLNQLRPNRLKYIAFYWSNFVTAWSITLLKFSQEKHIPLFDHVDTALRTKVCVLEVVFCPIHSSRQTFIVIGMIFRAFVTTSVNG